VSVTPPQGLGPRDVEQYAEAGVDRLVLQPLAFTGTAIDELVERAAQELLTAAPVRQTAP